MSRQVQGKNIPCLKFICWEQRETGDGLGQTRDVQSLPCCPWVTHHHPGDAQPKVTAHLECSKAESVCRSTFSPDCCSPQIKSSVSSPNNSGQGWEGLDCELLQ